MKNLKKCLVFIILSICIAFVMVSCSSDGSKKGNPEKTEVSEETTQVKTTELKTTEESFDGTKVEMTFFHLTYPDEWTENEEEHKDSETSSSILLEIKSADEVKQDLKLVVKKEDAGSYRDRLYNGNVNIQARVEGTEKWDNLLGIDGSIAELSKKPVFLARAQEAGATVILTSSAGFDDESVNKVLRSVKLNLIDEGNIDPPWPWDGEPIIVSETMSKMLGSFNFESKQIPIDSPVITHDIFNTDVAASGEYGYVLAEGALHCHNFDGESFHYIETMKLGDGYNNMSMASDGTVFLSHGFESVIVVKDAKKIAEYSDIYYLAIAPDGKHGISYFVNNEVEKVVIENNTVNKEKWMVNEFKIINHVQYSNNSIFVSGSAADGEKHAVGIYDYDGNLKVMLGHAGAEEQSILGSVTSFIELDDMYLLLDGNLREIHAYMKDGNRIGAMDDSDLFATNYPWISSACMLEDGSFLVGMTEERKDKSADEFILFKVRKTN